MSGDSFFAQVDPDPMCLASLNDDSTKPLTLPHCRDDALVDKGVVAPKPCLSSVEMRTLTTAGGLLPASTASIAMRTIKKSTSRTNNQLAPLCRWRFILYSNKIKTNFGV